MNEPGDTPLFGEDQGLQPDTFVGLLGLELWFGDDRSRGASTIRPSMWIPGTERPRLGVLTTMLDMVGGHTAEGPVSPTVDLRLTILDDPPASGRVDLVCDIKKWGRTLLVSETLLCDDTGRVFGRGTTTFLGGLLEGFALGRRTPPPDVDIASFDALMSPTVVDEHTLELEPRAALLNGVRGTVQGGVQTMFAELVAEHALAAGPIAIEDLDIRYLNGMKGGPMRGSATVLGEADGVVSVRVLLTDCAADDRLVSYVFLTARRLRGR